MIDAVINLLKPPGMTSHDAVSFIRRTFGQKRVGHSGTLDPAAAGVLPIYLGNATRLVEYGDNFDKAYRAEILFGISTDTGDDTGTITFNKPVGHLSMDNLERTVNSFAGLYDQVPPMYSALKVNGRKLYELAREGKEVLRMPRQVEIRSIRLLHHWQDRAVIQVECSKGTYIRTLCEDIGARMGLPATMGFLLRNRVGPFEIAQAVTLEEITENSRNVLRPPESAVAHFPAAYCSELETRYLRQGRIIRSSDENAPEAEKVSVRLYSDCGEFFGIGCLDTRTGLIKPGKIFAYGKEE